MSLMASKVNWTISGGIVVPFFMISVLRKWRGAKSPLYLMKNLSNGQLPHVLWHWFVGLLSQINN